MKSFFWRSLLPPVLVLTLWTALFEVVIAMDWLNPRLVPRPTSVFQAMQEDAAVWRAGLETLTAVAAGFGLSVLTGLLAAVGLSTSRWIQRAFYPYTVFFQTVPIVAIAPLLVIWIGYGMPAVIASAFIVSIFPMIANTLAGLLSTDPALRDLFRLYRAGSLATLWKLKLPSALPNILTGLRISAGLAVIGAIVGEFVGGGGLGMYIQTAMRAQAPERVYAAVLLGSVLGLVMIGLINLLGHLLLRRWHASELAN